MKKYPVTNPIKHNDKSFAVGDVIELDSKDAAHLWQHGFIGAVLDDAIEKPTDEQLAAIEAAKKSLKAEKAPAVSGAKGDAGKKPGAPRKSAPEPKAPADETKPPVSDASIAQDETNAGADETKPDSAGTAAADPAKADVAK